MEKKEYEREKQELNGKNIIFEFPTQVRNTIQTEQMIRELMAGELQTRLRHIFESGMKKEERIWE